MNFISLGSDSTQWRSVGFAKGGATPSNMFAREREKKNFAFFVGFGTHCV